MFSIIEAAASGSKKTRFHRESTRSVQEGWITCHKHHPIAGDLSYSSYSHRAAQSKDSKVQSKWWSERQNKIQGQDMREFIENKGQNNSRKMLKKWHGAIVNDKTYRYFTIRICRRESDNFTVNVVPLVGRATSPSSFTTLTDVDSTVLAYETRPQLEINGCR